MMKYALITAGGTGVRMNAPLPKQFLELCGRPVLMHTLEAFLRYDPQIQIILVLPQEQMGYWRELCQQFDFTHFHQLVNGGPTRFHSVKNGLKEVAEESIVAVHDGVRPLVSTQTIQNAFQQASVFGNAVPVVGVSESVRKKESAFNQVVDRSSLRIVQTPQCFKSGLIKAAYQANYDKSFTDDATVLEKAGQKIYLTEGNRENIKLTDPLDMIIAEAILTSTTNLSKGKP